MHRRAARVVVAAGLGLVLAACGSSSSGAGSSAGHHSASNPSSLAPKAELGQAASALYAGSTLTTTLSLDTTAAQVEQIDRHAAGKGSTGLTAAQAAAIAGAHLVIEQTAPAGKTLKDVKGGTLGGATSVIGASGATTYFEARVVNKDIYFRLDLQGILALAGLSSEYKTLALRTQSFPGFIRAAVTGQWVSLPLATVTALEGIANGALHGKIPTNTQLGAVARNLVMTIVGEVTVTRTSTGATDTLVATANLRQLARGVLQVIETGIPAAAKTVRSAPIHQVPNRPVTVNAAVTGGALSRVSVDVGSLATKPFFSLPLVATFTRSGPAVTAPTGATPFNLAQLGTLISAAGGSS